MRVTPLVACVIATAGGEETCAGGGLGGGRGTLGCCLLRSYQILYMSLSNICPYQPLAHTPAVVFHSDGDHTKADAENVGAVA